MSAPEVAADACDHDFNGVCARRVLAGGHQEYSQLQAFSDDGRYVLLASADGVRGIYDAETLALVHADTESAWNAPRWMPGAAHHQIVYFASAPARLMRFDLDSRATSTLVTTSYPQAIYSNPFEQPSDDGAWWSMYVQRDDGHRVILAVNATSGQVGATLPLDALYSSVCTPDPHYGNLEPDFIAITPRSRMLAVQWVRPVDARCGGLELFDAATGTFVRRLHTHHSHGDWGVAPDGRDFYLTSEDSSPLNENYPTFSLEYVDGSARRFPRMFAWNATGSAFDHVSCQARPASFCVVSGGGAYSGGPLPPGLGEIYLIYLDGSELRLFHHRSSGVDASGGEDYWALPKASISRDGRHIVFSSNWGSAGAIAPYQIDLR